MTMPFDLSPKENTILVVDDDPSIRSLIAESLAARGYRVEGAGDVAGARCALRTRACSLVLCDYGLPGESGLELVEYATRVYPDLPVIMLTGYDEVTLARAAIQACAPGGARPGGEPSTGRRCRAGRWPPGRRR